MNGGDFLIFENVKKLCKEHDINIMNLEKACGLGNGTIAAWESGNPRVDRLKLVADYFGVTIDELMRGDDTNNRVED